MIVFGSAFYRGIFIDKNCYVKRVISILTLGFQTAITILIHACIQVSSEIL
jgi:hypothetical protein